MFWKWQHWSQKNFQQARVYLIKVAWVWRNRSQNFIYHIQNKKARIKLDIMMLFWGGLFTEWSQSLLCRRRKSNEWREVVLQHMIKFESTTNWGSHLSTLFKVQTSLASVCALYAFVVVTTAPSPPSSDSSILLSQLLSWILTHICFTFFSLSLPHCCFWSSVACDCLRVTSVVFLPCMNRWVYGPTWYAFSRTCLFFFFWPDVIAVGVFYLSGNAFVLVLFLALMLHCLMRLFSLSLFLVCMCLFRCQEFSGEGNSYLYLI